MLRQALWSHRSGPACRTADGAVLLWADLYAQAARAAGFLTAHGARRAVLYGPAGPQAMTAIAACLLAGVTYIPADADTPPARLRALCAAAGADILLAMDAPPPDGSGLGLAVYPFAAAAAFSPGGAGAGAAGGHRLHPVHLRQHGHAARRLRDLRQSGAFSALVLGPAAHRRGAAAGHCLCGALCV